MTESTAIADFDWIALSALAISLCALVFTVIEVRRNQKHRELSVQPRLSYIFRVDKEVSFGLINKGLGPALLRKCTASLNDQEYDCFNIDDLRALAATIFGPYQQELDLVFTATQNVPPWIPSGEILELITSTEASRTLTKAEREHVLGRWSNVKMEFSYSDIYSPRDSDKPDKS